MKKKKDLAEQFLALSALLTGFERVDLQGTGLTEEYYRQLVGVIGKEICDELCLLSSRLIEELHDDEEKLNAAIRRQILASAKFGPVARNIIQMWYLGSWIQMPQGWRSEFGTSPNDVTRVISAEGYIQSLVYSVMGTHPPAAKQPGFGSWSQPPDSEVL
jgi:hypothetical protein